MNNRFEISGKSIVVVGAGGGIGSGIADCLHHCDAKLTLCDRNAAKLDKVSSGLSRNVTQYVGDISIAGECDALIAAAVDSYGGIDVVINAAGVLPIGDAAEIKKELFVDCLNNNVTAALLLSQAAKVSLQPGGSIIHIASVSSQVANERYAAYAASKAALAQMVKVLGREWAKDGVRVNAIGPALIETSLTSDYLADPEFRRNALASIPMGRLATVEDLLGTVLLLSSSAGAFITGQTIYVDGGRTLV